LDDKSKYTVYVKLLLQRSTYSGCVWYHSMMTLLFLNHLLTLCHWLLRNGINCVGKGSL